MRIIRGPNIIPIISIIIEGVSTKIGKEEDKGHVIDAPLVGEITKLLIVHNGSMCKERGINNRHCNIRYM